MFLKQADAAPAPVTTEAAPVEAAAPVAPAPEPVVETPAPQDDPKFAAKFAALSRREQSIRAKEQAVKEQEAEYRAYKDEQKLLLENPLEYLQKKGLTFDKLTQLALNDGKKPPEMRVQELEERLEREKLERAEADKVAASKAYEAQKQSFVSEISDFLTQNKEVYELVSVLEEPAELIYNVIEQHYEKNKRVLPVKDAVEMVEKHFEKEVDEKYMGLNKIKSRLQPKQPEPAAPPARVNAPTLTNTQASTIPTPSTNPVRSLEESKREAARLLKWT